MWFFGDYCSNKGLTVIKNRSGAYFCPQIPERLNLKSGRLLKGKAYQYNSNTNIERQGVPMQF